MASSGATRFGLQHARRSFMISARIWIDFFSAGGDTAGGRAVEMRQLSSDLIKSVDVIKGSTADMTEGSLGGGVKITTRSGLDFKKDFLSIRAATGGVATGRDPAQHVGAAGLLHTHAVEFHARQFGAVAADRHADPFTELAAVDGHAGDARDGVGHVPVREGTHVFGNDRILRRIGALLAGDCAALGVA